MHACIFLATAYCFLTAEWQQLRCHLPMQDPREAEATEAEAETAAAEGSIYTSMCT